MSPEKIAAALGSVPEEQRTCTSCGKPVGRSIDGRPGRVQGFCGSCRTPFNFVLNAPTLAAGALVGGQYEIVGPMAHGGLGWIYLGRDRAVSNRWVVLKGLLNANDPDAVAAAVAERQFLAQIEHSNIVNIYNFVTWAGAGYIVMEFVGGESLNAKLKARRTANGGMPSPLPPAEAIAYVLGILPAFGYLHRQGLVYNDLKPANIMAVDEDVKLIDLGAVMRIDDPDAAIFGTVGFQAPEIATMGPSVPSDLFTVGRTLAVLLLNFVFHTGQYEFALPTPVDEPLFAQWESLYRFLLKSTAPHPDDRFQSAEEMSDQLVGILREIVAITEHQPRPVLSNLFGPDRLPAMLADGRTRNGAAGADWRALPVPKINPADLAAPVLVDLPDAEPSQLLGLIDSAVAGGQVGETREVQLARARTLIELSAQADAAHAAAASEEILAAVEAEDPWEWRVEWYRALASLLHGHWSDAAERFSRVWTELPGELAPKLGVALAAERAGELLRAAQLYDLVVSVDATYVSAAFGLARCRAASGDRAGAVAALARVPSSSSTYVDAQVSSARALLDGRAAAPSATELATAAATVERLTLDARERSKIAVEILGRALGGVTDGSLSPDPAVQLFGHPLAEPQLRVGLEAAYRELARLAPSTEERIALVDRANSLRPRTLV
ncbi:MAG: serine/threonine-protein kinase PknG, partial [Acidimicrobiia bacterium]|nr:serine/threonine-protein kinase PknG [Acidimicrobiia bacterium]